MVVFENGEADPSQYRLFNIKEADSQDDLAMLQEVLERRLKHDEWPLPQIVFVDGGANQVKRVNAVLKQHNLILPVVGLSKAGQHAASSASQDKFVVANAKKAGKELITASRNLFQQVRNEAHRFSINARRKRSKRGFLRK
jgi:excinuclease ABC subunit C